MNIEFQNFGTFSTDSFSGNMEMKMCKYLVCLVLSMFIGISHADLAWWLTAKYEPSQVKSPLFKMAEINRDWAKFKVLSYEDLSGEAKEYIPRMKSDGYTFSIDSDLNGDGRPDKALVGVYQTKGGDRGRFLLVLIKNKKGKWTKSFLSESKGDPGFSVLYKCGDRICWSECMECGGGPSLEWDKDHYFLDDTGLD